MGRSPELTIEAEGIAQGVLIDRVVIELRYDRRQLLPRGFRAMSGGAAVGRSQLTAVAPGHARIELDFTSPLTADGPVGALECEILRSESAMTKIDLGGQSADTACVQAWSGVFEIDAECGEPAGIRTDGARMLRITPTPASEQVELNLVHPEEGPAGVDIVDPLGRVVAATAFSEAPPTRSAAIDVGALDAGFYLARAHVNGRMVESAPLIIAR
jgi:hypothetical protein